MVSYPAPGDTPFFIEVMHKTFMAPIMGVFFYGIHFVLFVSTLRHLCQRKNMREIQWPFVAFVCLLFICGTLYIAGSIHWRILTFIDDRGYPGGPTAYYFEQFANPAIIASNCGYIVINCAADALLLWRCWIIYSRSYLVILLPTLMFLASTTLSVIVTISIAKSTVSRLGSIVARISLPYWALSISLNIVLTLLIASRLLRGGMARRDSQNSRVFKGIITMLVESASLYAINGIIVIVFYVKKDPLFDVFLHIQGQLMCISPLLILIRVAQGRAYAQNMHMSAPDVLPMSRAETSPDEQSIGSARVPSFRVGSSRQSTSTVPPMEYIGRRDAFDVMGPADAKVEPCTNSLRSGSR